MFNSVNLLLVDDIGGLTIVFQVLKYKCPLCRTHKEDRYPTPHSGPITILVIAYDPVLGVVSINFYSKFIACRDERFHLFLGSPEEKVGAGASFSGNSITYREFLGDPFGEGGSIWSFPLLRGGHVGEEPAVLGVPGLEPAGRRRSGSRHGRRPLPSALGGGVL